MDFYPVMVNITFSPGKQSSLISIEIINDSEVETSETFTLHLTSFSSNVVIDTPNATVIIVDDGSMTINPNPIIQIGSSSGHISACRLPSYTLHVKLEGLVVYTKSILFIPKSIFLDIDGSM